MAVVGHVNPDGTDVDEPAGFGTSPYPDVSGSGGGINASRQTATATTGSLVLGATDSSTMIALSKGYVLYSISTSQPARVRLYESAEARDADLTRSISVDPASTAGVVLDYVTSDNETYSFSPLIVGANLEEDSTDIPMSVTNMDGTNTITITLTWLQVE